MMSERADHEQRVSLESLREFLTPQSIPSAFSGHVPDPDFHLEEAAARASSHFPQSESDSASSHFQQRLSESSSRSRPHHKRESSHGVLIRETPAWAAEGRSSLPAIERLSLRDLPIPKDVLETILAFAPEVRRRFTGSKVDVAGRRGAVGTTNGVDAPRLATSGVRVRPVSRVLTKRTRAVRRVGEGGADKSAAGAGARSLVAAAEDAAPEPTAEGFFVSMSVPRAEALERRRPKDNYSGAIVRATFRGTSAEALIKMLRSWEVQCALNPTSKLVFRDSPGRRMFTATVAMPAVIPRWLRSDRMTFSDTQYFIVEEEDCFGKERVGIDSRLHGYLNLALDPTSKKHRKIVNPVCCNKVKVC